VIPELPEIISGFTSCYPKFPNKIRVSGISGSGSGIPGSGFGLRVFCPALAKEILLLTTVSPTIFMREDYSKFSNKANIVNSSLSILLY
jgi:hypothetical protein